MYWMARSFLRAAGHRRVLATSSLLAYTQSMQHQKLLLNILESGSGFLETPNVPTDHTRTPSLVFQCRLMRQPDPFAQVG